MEQYIRWWLKGMKWFIVMLTPIACFISFALPIWTSFYPWDEAKKKLNEAYSEVTAIQVAGGSSNHWSAEHKFESRSATYVLFPQVFSSFKAVTFYKENNNGILKEEISESTGVLIWMIFMDVALIMVTMYWSIPTIKTKISNGIS